MGSDAGGSTDAVAVRREGRRADDPGPVAPGSKAEPPTTTGVPVSRTASTWRRASGRNDDREQLEQHRAGAGLVDVADQALGGGVRAEVADREALARRCSVTIRAGSACHSCSTQDHDQRGALRGPRRASRSRSTASVVSTASLIAVAACSWATLQVSATQSSPTRSCAGARRCWISVEHVVALGAQRAHLAQRGGAVPAPERVEVGADLVVPGDVDGHRSPLGLDGEDRDVVVGPVAQVRGQRDRDALDLGPHVAGAGLLQHLAHPVVAEPGAAPGASGTPSV